MEKVEKLVKKAAELQPAERIKLVEEILKTLDAIDPSIERCWVNESEERYEDFKKGKQKTVEWSIIQKRYTR